MKRTRGDLKPGTVFKYLPLPGRPDTGITTRAVKNLVLPGAPKADDLERSPTPGREVIVIWEPGDSPQSTEVHDRNRVFYDGKTAEECLTLYTRMMQEADLKQTQTTGVFVKLTPVQFSVGRNEWRRVLAEKVKETARKERESVKVDLMYEEWE